VFEIPFDGQKLIWTLKSFNGNQKTSAASEASSTSNKCSAHLNREMSANSTEPESLHVYPNPTTGIIRIELPESGERSTIFRVMDFMGKEVMPQQVLPAHDTALLLDLSALPTGVYLLLREAEGTNTSVERIVKY
jgi:sugar/nucleoside kinase (ribokinase family)